MKKICLYICAFVTLLGVSACHKKYIDNSKIPDTEDNRAILDLLKAYSSALEEKDAEKLMSLVAPYYFEDMATPDKSDDFTIDELRDKVIPEIFAHTDKLYLDILVDDLVSTKDKASVDVRYEYRAHLTFPSGDKWVNDTALNRLDLIKIDGKWLVINGL